MEEREILVDIVVQVEQPPLGQLHYRRGGKQLGDRSDAEESLVWDDRHLLFQVGKAVPFSEKDLAVFDQKEHRTGDMEFLHLLGKEGGQEGFEFLGIGWSLLAGDQRRRLVRLSLRPLGRAREGGQQQNQES